MKLTKKPEAFDKINKENIELRDLVKRRTIELEEKNRELEIETALEKVRTIALSMKKPADMLVVCKTISLQLQSLGVKEIRNVQTAIFYESKGTLMNYEYYSKHRKTIITETSYTNHKIPRAFASKMLKGEDEFFATHIKGKKLKEWFAYQKTTNVFIDRFLEKASSLNYYYYSLGPGALGISTYIILNEEDLQLFKRFRNVFELAYRRFMDIELAIAQAKEAQIQLALERVRARAMAMYASEELKEAANLLYHELQSLGIKKFINCGYVLIDEKNNTQLAWMTHRDGTIREGHKMPLTGDWVMNERYESWKRKDPIFVQLVGGKKLKSHLLFVAGRTYTKEGSDNVIPQLPDPTVFYCAHFSEGYLHILADQELTKESTTILSRFTTVFEITFRRFLDLQKAEASAKEAQIEAALERVRSRSLAMHKSNELQEVIDTVFDQILKLGILADVANFIIFNQENKDINCWIASPTQKIRRSWHMPYIDIFPMNALFIGKENGNDSLSVSCSFEQKNKFFNWAFEHSDFKFFPDDRKEFVLTSKCWAISYAWVKHTGIQLSNYSRESFAENENEILKRFARVFEQAYTRFLDLQKAEAQSREAQIELALERVRARTMAMQKSEELHETSQILFQQMKELGEPVEQLTIGIVKETENVVEVFATVLGSQLQQSFRHSIDEPTVMNKIYKGWKAQQKSLLVEMNSDDIRVYNRYRNELVKSEMFSTKVSKDDRRILYAAYFSKGMLALGSNTSLSEESHRLLERFAGVFDGTYTRFLDLQKAEAQAREAQIELGLERVRARAMAMQKSDELSELVETVFKELTKLDFALSWCMINIIDEHSMSNTVWGANPEIGKAPESYNMLFEDYRFHHEMFKAWKEKQAKWTIVLEGREKEIYDEYLFNQTEFRRVPELVQQQMRATKKYEGSFTFSNFGGLQTIGEEPLSEANLEILARFGKVFDLTYTRFNDLKKAEAQAREAKIEGALERVRSQSMGMQTSKDLSNVTTAMFEQLRILGGELYATGIVFCEKHENQVEQWHSVPGAGMLSPFIVPIDLDHIHQYRYDQWKKGTELFSVEIPEDFIAQHFDAMFNLPTVKAVMEDFAAKNIPMPETPSWEIDYGASFKHGYILVSALQPFTEAVILPRFAKVFEQTYTRFLDLQKAEAQAKEATIEAALERVRSRTMAMQRSEELKDVASILFKHVEELGLHSFASGVHLWIEDGKAITIWSCTEGEMLPPFRLPLMGDPAMRHIYESGKEGKSLYVEEMGGEALKEHYEYLFSFPDIKEIFGDLSDAGFPVPEFQIFHAAYFSCGYLMFITHEPCTEAHDIFIRFAKVFEQTYTRFLDLQKAEAQAREAKIEAALERVRSRSLAMYKTDDLGEVVSVLFHQMQGLSVDMSFASVSIFIFEKDSRNIIQWIHLPDGVVSLRIPYFEHPISFDLFNAKASGVDYFSKVYTVEEKNTWVQKGFELTDYKNLPEEFKITLMDAPGYAMAIALANNSGICIPSFVGSYPSTEDVEIMKRVGKVFEQAYTRFLDLQKAEAQTREAKIEAALEKVRSRSLAMHHANELGEVVVVIVEKIKELDIEMDGGITLVTFIPGSKDFLEWHANPDHSEETLTGVLSYFDNTIFNDCVVAVEQGMELLTKVYSKDEKDSYINYLAEHTAYIPDDMAQWIREQPYMGFSFAIQKHSGIFLQDFTGKFFSKEDNDILIRFSRVFEQSYIRFLDLQKAEAQARESQIEAGLERVRSRTLAMQKSDELAETAAEVFKQLIGLGIEPNRLYIGIIEDENGDMEMWATDEDGTQVGQQFMFNKKENASVKKLYDGWAAKEKSVIVDMEGKELEDYFHYLNEVMHIPFKDGLTQKRRVQSVAYFSRGFIGMASPDGQGTGTIQLLERFAAVFNLTFTRFNDLKVAEAHAIQADEDLVKLQKEKKRAEDALTELKSTQTQLIQSEKMASLGELTAGIAHEIQNPLNFVNNFSEVSNELMEEMKEELTKGNYADAIEIANDVKQNLEKINHHGKRADGIVKGMLQHSLSSSGVKEPTDINVLCDEYLRLSYHGLRAKDKSFNATMKTDFDNSIGNINIIPQDIGRVVLNLLTNAFYAVDERLRQAQPDKADVTQSQSKGYEPTVSISTKKIGNKVEIKVTDNGNGIPQNVLDKIFQPFFTTKPTGQGTGLGLSMSYDIVTMGHGGELKVETKESEGSTFIIQLPL